DLRLDDRDAAIDYGAIVPGDASMSSMVERILSDDPDLVMPPRDAKQKLTPVERELLRQWVEEGAAYEKHWAFTPPAKPALPEVKNATWGATPIDKFVAARLEKEGLEPSPAADRRTL